MKFKDLMKFKDSMFCHSLLEYFDDVEDEEDE